MKTLNMKFYLIKSCHTFISIFFSYFFGFLTLNFQELAKRNENRVQEKTTKKKSKKILMEISQTPKKFLYFLHTICPRKFQLRPKKKLKQKIFCFSFNRKKRKDQINRLIKFKKSKSKNKNSKKPNIYVQLNTFYSFGYHWVTKENAK